MRDAILFWAQVVSAIAAVVSVLLALRKDPHPRIAAGVPESTAADGRRQARGAPWSLAVAGAFAVLFVVLLVANRHAGCGQSMPSYSSDPATMADRWCVSEDQLVQPAPEGWQFTGAVPVWAGMCLDVYASTDDEFRSHLESGATVGPISHPSNSRSRGQLLSNGKAMGLATLYWVGCPG